MDQKDIQAAIKSCKDRIKSITSVPDYQPGKRQRKRAVELEYVKIAALTQPGRKHGKWEGAWNPGFMSKQTHCTICGWENHHCVEFDFCPNCGAKMDQGTL